MLCQKLRVYSRCMMGQSHGPVILPILVMVKMNILMYPFYRRQEIFGNNLLHSFLNRIREMVSFELGKEIGVGRLTNDECLKYFNASKIQTN